MAAVVTEDYKYTLGYTANRNGELATKTLSGINIGLTSNPSIGPTVTNAIDSIYAALTALSTAEITNGRWITERVVTF